jgi:hypothetical protein
MKRRALVRRLSVRLLVVLGGVLVGLLTAEAGLRLIGFRYLNLYQGDREVGFSLRPGAEGWWQREGETYIKINSAGLRDREHSPVKPPGTLRIAVLGDSFAEALQVPMEAAFWAIAERKLQGCEAMGGRRVEMINFGVSGFSTARELITLRRRVWQYSPDIVVLLVTTSNDVRDNSRRLSLRYGNQPLPYFVYRDGALVLDDSLLRGRNESPKFRLQQSFLGGSLDGLRNHVRLMGLLDKAREALENYKQKRRENPTAVGYEPGLDTEVYRAPVDPDWSEAWRVTEGLMMLMRDEVRAHGAKFLLVTGGSSIQDYPDGEVRRRFMQSVGTDDLFYPDHRIKVLGEREGIEVLNLAPTLQEYADRNKTFLHGTDGFGHWNVLGHHLAGDLIAERLCETTAASR